MTADPDQEINLKTLFSSVSVAKRTVPPVVFVRRNSCARVCAEELTEISMKYSVTSVK